MKWMTDVLVVAAALLLGQTGVFYLAACRCEYELVRPSDAPTALKALVVSDVHLLGKRRRSLVERLWVDAQISTSIQAAVHVHRPDVVLVLGDQLDEGGHPTSDEDYEEYIRRFTNVFIWTKDIETIYLIGNHDSSFGRFLTKSAISRHERAFGASNYVTMVKGHKIIRLNTMALDSDISNVEINAQASSFLKKLTQEHKQDQTELLRFVILLSHFPLYRADDLACGTERLREHGHVTYEHPSFKYETHHHVLSQELSRDLLEQLQPNVVLSGHTHAWCEFHHGSSEAHVSEYTIPAFSWGQRPDPSYALLSASGTDHRVSRCALPKEPLVFLFYGVVVAVVVVRLLWRCAMMSRTKERLHHHTKKLK